MYFEHKVAAISDTRKCENEPTAEKILRRPHHARSPCCSDPSSGAQRPGLQRSNWVFRSFMDAETANIQNEPTAARGAGASPAFVRNNEGEAPSPLMNGENEPTAEDAVPSKARGVGVPLAFVRKNEGKVPSPLMNPRPITDAVFRSRRASV